MVLLLVEDSALARPLIRHFGLVRIPRAIQFPLYRTRTDGRGGPERTARPEQAGDGQRSGREVLLAVAGPGKRETASCAGFLAGTALAESGPSVRPGLLFAGVFRFPAAGGPATDGRPFAVIARADDGGEEGAVPPDLLYAHRFPEIRLEPGKGGEGSPAAAFVHAALSFAGPHQLLALCADEAAGSEYPQNVSRLIDAASGASVAGDRAAPSASDHAVSPRAQSGELRDLIAERLRLTHSQRTELGHLLAEHEARAGQLPSQLLRFTRASAATKAEAKRLLAEL
ncbi:hypothetical protein, partial [Salinispira pacifica]